MSNLLDARRSSIKGTPSPTSAWSAGPLRLDLQPQESEPEESTDTKPKNFFTPTKWLIGTVLVLLVIGIIVAIYLLTKEEEKIGKL